MAVITPPDLSNPPIEDVPGTDETLPEMEPSFGTALTTGSRLTIPQLLTTFAFYRDFAKASVLAGPFFSALNIKEANRLRDLAWSRLKAARERQRYEAAPVDDPDLHVRLPVGR